MANISKYERTRSNDIKYRGPLSYRHLMMLGWLCISFKVLHALTSLGISLDPNQPKWILTLNTVSEYVAAMALPFFLISNFAIILDKKQTYKQQLIKYGGLSLLIVLLFVIIKEHYIVGIVTAVVGNRAEAQKIVHDSLYEMAVTGSMIFNLFIDLFMCTLFMFFLEYKPKKYFQGDKITLFRAMAAIPIVYEVGALALRVFIAMTGFIPPYFVYPMLTTKPFMSFILFVILTIHIKLESARFKKRGKTAEDFAEYAQTNAHSLRFSIFTSLMILITGLIDIIVYIISDVLLTMFVAGVDINAELTDQAVSAMEKMLPLADRAVTAWGFGKHGAMILTIPIILLFSYTRNHENKSLDLFIPVGGIVLAVLVGIEGVY
ncbi:MAG: hypothetical protein Q4G47_05015, partial [Lachnospiraceae bacterium]|nr:hypothetical protein [Lachnospiraceae bacterium]